MSKELVKYSRFQNYSNVVDLLEIFKNNRETTLREVDSILHKYNDYCKLIQGVDFRILFYDTVLQLIGKMKQDILSQLYARKCSAYDEKNLKDLAENIWEKFMEWKINKWNIYNDMYNQYQQIKKEWGEYEDIEVFLYHYTNLIEKFITNKKEKIDLTISLEWSYVVLYLDLIQRGINKKYMEYATNGNKYYKFDFEEDSACIDLLEKTIQRDFEIPMYQVESVFATARSYMKEKIELLERVEKREHMG
jgi:hypothetical protein